MAAGLGKKLHVTGSPAGVLADSPEAIVAAFDRFSESFGHDWVEGSRFGNGVEQRGILATLPIVTLGKLLAVVEPIAWEHEAR